MANEKKIIKEIIKRHGPVIDLRESPETMIEILRRFRLDDGGGLPGGVPPSPPPPDGGTPPPPPPGPSSFQDRPTIDDVMREVLKVSRNVAKLNQQFAGGAAAKTAAKAKKR